MKIISKINIIIWILLISMPGLGQKTIDLSGQLSGQQTHVARDMVTLLPGFEYTTSSTSYNFDAYMDQTIILDADYTPDNEIVLPESRTIDKSLPVGTPAGGFSVGSNGTANYQIPIAVAPGTGGMVPSLSFSYNNMSGNGFAGQGWNIGGISAIYRVGTDLYHEGVAEDVQMDGNDRFELDGQRLTKINGTYGADNTVYAPEVENFSRITSHGNIGGGPQYFTVLTKNGTTITYGNADANANANLMVGNFTPVYAWYIYKVEDNNGNYMVYSYSTNADNGEILLESVEYTGNDVAGINPYNEVKFYYQTRQDTNIENLGDLEFLEDKIIRRVESFSNGTLLRRYDPKYFFNKYTYLNEMLVYNPNLEHHNSLAFSYEAHANETERTIATIASNELSIIGDFNKSGSQDLFTISDDGTANIYEYDHRTAAYKTTPYHSAYLDSKPYKLVSGDFNGDGTPDVVMFYSLPFNVFSAKYYSFNESTNAFEYQGALNVKNGIATNVYVKDFNGDRIDDLLMVAEASDEYMLKIGERDNSILSSTTSHTLTGISSAKQFGRFNLLGSNSSGEKLVLRISNNLQFYDAVYVGSDYILQNVYTEPIESNYDYRIVNLDGTSGSDILKNISGKSNFSFVGLNSFTGFDYYPIDFVNVPANLGDYSYFVEDVDGDEADDIITYELISGQTHFKVWLSTNNYASSIDYVKSPGFAPVVVDLIGMGEVVLLKDGTSIRKYDFASENRPALLTNIADGMDRKIQITYNVSTDPEFVEHSPEYYDSETAGLTTPRRLVQMYSTTSGFATDYATSYTYGNAVTFLAKNNKRHLGFATGSIVGKSSGPYIGWTYTDIVDNDKSNPGGAFVGFGKRIITNVVTNESSTITKVFDGMYPSEVKTEKRNKSQQLFATSTTYFGSTFLGLGRVKRFADSSHSTNHLTGITSTSNLTYDDHLNVIQSVVDHNGLASTTTNSYYSLHGGQFKNAPDSIRVTKHIDGKTDYTRKTEFTYNGYKLATTTSDPGTDKEIVTSLTYDNVGNVTRTDVTPSDGAATSFVEVEFDNIYKRFVENKTVTGDFVETYTYDDYTGALLSSTDIYGTTTEFTYDNWGALVSTTHPLTGTSSVKKEWSDGSIGGDVVKITASADGVPDAITYLDILGRTIKAEGKKFEGTPIYTSYVYSLDGSSAQVSLPYEGAQPTQWNTVEYDDYYRVSNKYGPGSSVSYAYQGLQSTVTNNITQNSSTTTLNGLGQVESVTDPYGTISYTYYTAGNVHEVTTADGTITSTYDLHGNTLQTTSLNAGTTSATYNSIGQVLTTTNAKNQVTSYAYDNLGRLDYYTDITGTTDYTYVGSGDGKGQIESITGPTGMAQSFTYDSYGRSISTKETIDETDYNINFTFDNLSRVKTMTYPSGFELTYNYNNDGRLTGVNHGSHNIWTLTETNQLGQVTGFDLGNGLSSAYTYNELGQVTGIVTGTIQDLSYEYNDKHLISARHDDSRTLSESFTYDAKHLRLASYTVTGQPTVNLTYNDNGNITDKSDIGAYSYEDGAHPHAVTKVESANQLYADPDQDITYNHFNKVTQISENGYELNIEYGVGGLRKKTVLNHNSTTQKTKIFIGGIYEKETLADDTERQLHYIAGPMGTAAIFVKNGTKDTMYYVHKDHLGSFNVITDEAGDVVEEMSFDPWGRRRNVSDWTMNNVKTSYLFDRGYTGHEHLDVFNLVNMNGRVFDPVMARMLSPDPFVQGQFGSSAFNSYAYVANNPLTFTDPSGYLTRRREREDWLEETSKINLGGGGGWGINTGDPAFGSMGFSAVGNGDYVDIATGNILTQDEYFSYQVSIYGGSYMSATPQNGVFTDEHKSSILAYVNKVNYHWSAHETVITDPETGFQYMGWKTIKTWKSIDFVLEHIPMVYVNNTKQRGDELNALWKRMEKEGKIYPLGANPTYKSDYLSFSFELNHKQAVTLLDGTEDAINTVGFGVGFIPPTGWVNSIALFGKAMEIGRIESNYFMRDPLDLNGIIVSGYRTLSATYGWITTVTVRDRSSGEVLGSYTYP